MAMPTPDPSADPRLEAVIASYLEAVERGEDPDRDALLAAHPDLADALRAFFADHDRMRALVVPRGDEDDEDDPFLAPTAPHLGGTGLSRGARLRYVGDYELLDEIAVAPGPDHVGDPVRPVGNAALPEERDERLLAALRDRAERVGDEGAALGLRGDRARAAEVSLLAKHHEEFHGTREGSLEDPAVHFARIRLREARGRYPEATDEHPKRDPPR